MIGIFEGLRGTLTLPADDGQKAITPAVTLVEDRARVFALTLTWGPAPWLVFWLVAALVAWLTPLTKIGLAATLVAWLTPAIKIGLVATLVAGLVVGLGSAWGAFCLVRPLLALYGRTPLRLMTFLHEAHNRGVLRQAGSVYQFRHNRLQDHLTNPPAPQRFAP